MKVLKRLLVVSLPILSAACASLPGVSIVAPPAERINPPQLPPPAPCLAPIETPPLNELPTLPDLIAAPEGAPRESLEWWRQAARHFESRARRAEMVQSFATNIADDERQARVSNAENQQACAAALRTREAQNAPVG